MMDPNETIRLLRIIVTENTPDNTGDGSDLGEMIELFDALDNWLVKGGFPPAVWMDAFRNRPAEPASEDP
jgi:hypothetical protein